jgi:hypothetical protein
MATAMRTVFYLASAVLFLGLGAAGFVYYQHRHNTLVELDVGSHSVSLQKN